jgi:hypothetical protein
MKYRKKPVVIDAVQWTGNISELSAFLAEFDLHITPPNGEPSCSKCAMSLSETGSIIIPTLEGVMAASASSKDWIIRGIQGEFYPCKPDIFQATYTSVSDESDV